jgi:hypothetical protein
MMIDFLSIHGINLDKIRNVKNRFVEIKKIKDESSEENYKMQIEKFKKEMVEFLHDSFTK